MVKTCKFCTFVISVSSFLNVYLAQVNRSYAILTSQLWLFLSMFSVCKYKLHVCYLGITISLTSEANIYPPLSIPISIRIGASWMYTSLPEHINFANTEQATTLDVYFACVSMPCFLLPSTLWKQDCV